METTLRFQEETVVGLTLDEQERAYDSNYRGEQPDDQALPVDGALRGDTPLSNLDKEIK